jgi:hypothetical protein
MPRLNVTTKSANQVWASPDGQRAIFELVLDYAGKQFKAKTYSKAIATVGWSGEVETEERAGKFGPETFVKQPQKAGGFGGNRGGQQDPFAMYLSYAKDLAVAFVTLEGKLNPTEFKKALKATIEGGKALYESRPDAQTNTAGQEGTQEQQTASDSLATVKEVMGDDVVVEDIGDEPITMDDLPDL